MKYFLTILFLSTILISCNKSDQILPSNNVVKIDTKALARKIILDSSFANLYEAAALDLYTNSQENRFKVTDSVTAIMQHKKLVNYFVIFISNYPSILTMKNAENKELINEIKELSKSTEFRENHKPELLLLDSKTKNIINYIHENPTKEDLVKSNSTLSTTLKSNKLTTDEAFECLIGIAGSVLGGYGKEFDKILRLRKILSFEALITASIGIIVAASPWYKVATITLSLGSCAYNVFD